MCSPLAAGGRNPGSVLIYPIHRSGGALFTTVSVTNTHLLPISGSTLGGSTNLHFEYVNVLPDPAQPLIPKDCSIINRIEYLTPADTLSVLTSCHNATGGQEGYLVVTAQDPLLQPTAWCHNFLVGSEMVINALGGMYSINAISLRSPQPGRTATDRDGDDELDFDGIEYEGLPEHLYIDNFLAQGQSSLTLLNLTGSIDNHVAALAIDIWNDNEYALSSTLSFKCWIEEPLLNISLVFSDGFLANNTPDDPSELDIDCDNIGDLEMGWARIRGLNASSPGQSIPNPAIMGAITAGIAPSIDGGHLLWESSESQWNGDFAKFGTIDFEFPE